MDWAKNSKITVGYSLCMGEYLVCVERSVTIPTKSKKVAIIPNVQGEKS